MSHLLANQQISGYAGLKYEVLNLRRGCSFMQHGQYYWQWNIFISDNAEPRPPHTITSLIIGAGYQSIIDFRDHDAIEHFRSLLRALPSLKFLSVYCPVVTIPGAMADILSLNAPNLVRFSVFYGSGRSWHSFVGIPGFKKSFQTLSASMPAGWQSCYTELIDIPREYGRAAYMGLLKKGDISELDMNPFESSNGTGCHFRMM